MSKRSGAAMRSAWGPERTQSTSSLIIPTPLVELAFKKVDGDAVFELDPGPSSVSSQRAAESSPSVPPSLRALQDPAIESEAASFLVTVREIARDDEPEDALDLIYQGVDRFMRGGRFDVCRAIIASADAEALPLVHALAFASITQPAREHLGSSRVGYVARLRDRLLRTDPERVEELLAGIE